MKARKLSKLKFRRVDLVSDGANQLADVTLYKAAEGKPKAEEVECAKCGEMVSAAKKFCPECGAAMKKSMTGGKTMEPTAEITKLQGDVKAATELAQEEQSKREAVEKAQKETASKL